MWHPNSLLWRLPEEHGGLKEAAVCGISQRLKCAEEVNSPSTVRETDHRLKTEV